MKELPRILEGKELKELLEKKEAIFFNYRGQLPDISSQYLLRLIRGRKNILLESNLYKKREDFTYELYIENWLKTEEARAYAPLLLKMNGALIAMMSYKEYLLRHKNKHLN